MSNKRIETPLDAWPAMEILRDEPAVKVTGKYTTPSWQWSETIPSFLAIVGFIIMPFSCTSFGDARYGDWEEMPGDVVIYFFLIWTFATVAVLQIIYSLATRRKIDVKFTPDTIDIAGRSYARADGLNQFAIEQHELAAQEAQRIRRSGKGARFYLDAVQVVMRYGEKRVPIAGFREKDIRKAEALLVRLQMLAKSADDILAQGAPPAPAVQDDFGPRKAIR